MTPFAGISGQKESCYNKKHKAGCKENDLKFSHLTPFLQVKVSLLRFGNRILFPAGFAAIYAVFQHHVIASTVSAIDLQHCVLTSV